MKRVVEIFGVCSLLLCLLMTGCGSKEKNVTNEEITLNVSWGLVTGTYTGKLVDGIPTGTGSFKNADSWQYDGEFVDGTITGKGKITFASGVVKEGTYTAGRLNGKGISYSKGVKLYEGDFVDDIFSGQGKLFRKDGQVAYEGEFIGGLPEESAFKGVCTSIAYADLARSPELYVDMPIKFTGRVIQVMEGEGDAASYRVATNGRYDDVIYVEYTRKSGEARILEDDVITLWGFSGGLYTYKSTGSGNISIPSLNARFVEIQ